MGVLRIVLPFLILVGCYDPAVPSCTVTCNQETDCVDSQNCNGGYCVGAGADSCEPPTMAMPDAGMPTTALRIEIEGGRGRIAIVGGQSCEMDCTLVVPRGRAIQLTATMIDKPFERWEMACTGQAATCNLTPSASEMTVIAKFGNGGGDD